MRAKAIDRTVLDAPALSLYLNASTPRRPLPLLGDLLQILYDRSEGAEWLVFTNADIGLQPGERRLAGMKQRRVKRAKAG